MLDWHSCQICYPLEIKLSLLRTADCQITRFVFWTSCSSISSFFLLILQITAGNRAFDQNLFKK